MVSAAVAVSGVEVIMTNEKPIFQEFVSLAGRVARTESNGYPTLGIRYLQVEGCAGPTRDGTIGACKAPPACVTSFPGLHDCESPDRRLQTPLCISAHHFILRPSFAPGFFYHFYFSL